MDEAEKEKSITILNSIIEDIDLQIISIDKNINIQNEIISNTTKQLEETTNEIVVCESQISQENENLNNHNSTIEGLNSKYSDLDREINELRISEKDISNILLSWDSLLIFLNPNAFYVSKINSIREKINCIEAEKDNKRREMDEINGKKYEIEKLIESTNQNINNKKQIIQDKETSLKELGIQKTKTEDIRLRLLSTRNQCQMIIENSKLGKELLEYDINMVNQVINELKSFYLENQLKSKLIESTYC